MKNDKIKTVGSQLDITQKSKPVFQNTIRHSASHPQPLARKTGRNMDISRSRSIAHFTPRPKVESPVIRPTLVKKQFDIGPTRHPLTKTAQQKTTPPEPVKSDKEAVIAEAFAKLSEQQKTSKEQIKHKTKLIKLIILGVTIVLIVCYFIFINIPTISVSVASAQAGIKAAYPEYRPQGYDLEGPVASSEGQITMTFKADSGKKFSITQKKSSWDSSAVKDKVNNDSKGEFITTAEGGLTIYSYSGNAAWVNGGILYTVSGDAPLTSDQIRRIATSF